MENLIVILILCLFVGFLIKFLHWIIGEPSHNQQTGISLQSGRVFSWYGAFVLNNYVKAYNAEFKRCNEKYQKEVIEAIQAPIIFQKQKKIAEIKSRLDGKEYFDALNKIEAEHLKNIEEAMSKIDTLAHFNYMAKQRGNIWQPLGVCQMCFGTWVSLAAMLILLGLFGFSFFWAILAVPMATIISLRVKI